MKQIIKKFLSTVSSGEKVVRGYGNISPVKKPRGGNALNKAGRLVLKAVQNGRDVKIYEAASREHALFIQAVSKHPSLSTYFPEIIRLHGAFVVAEWVHSDSKTLPLPKELVLIQTQLHRIPSDSLPTPGFNYWSDFLRPRFLRAVDLLGEEDAGKRIVNRIDNAWNQTPRLMHPDLSLANLVRTQGQLKIVDNELLTLGGIPLLDICNTAYSLGKNGAAYANQYFHAEHYFSQRDFEIIRDMWTARRLGSFLTAGNISAAMGFFRLAFSGENILPFRTPT